MAKLLDKRWLRVYNGNVGIEPRDTRLVDPALSGDSSVGWQARPRQDHESCSRPRPMAVGRRQAFPRLPRAVQPRWCVYAPAPSGLRSGGASPDILIPPALLGVLRLSGLWAQITHPTMSGRVGAIALRCPERFRPIDKGVIGSLPKRGVGAEG